MHLSTLLLFLSQFCTAVHALPVYTRPRVSNQAVQHAVPDYALPITPEAAARRNYFYVGGQYQNASDGSGLLRIGQLYVEQLIPAAGPCKKYPLVFWHGAAQTGANWLNTPDGRQGWASYFLNEGYVVYIVDQPQRGRSSWELSQGTPTYFPVSMLESIFTAPEKYKLWPQAVLHTQWPGTGQQGDPIFDHFYSSQVQYDGNVPLSAQLNRDAGVALLDTIGPAILITHSQGGEYGWLIADARPSLVKGILTIEPIGPPFNNTGPAGNAFLRPYGLTSQPLTYDPPMTSPSDLERQTLPPAGANLSSCVEQVAPARQLVNLAQVPIAVMTGEASNHAPYEYCTTQYLEDAGVNVQNLDLGTEGIHGNGHFVFIEKNNLEVASVAEAFFDSIVD